MENSYLKRNDETILPVSQASNIFDENGIDLQTHLDLIYSEIGKRDIKRIYREVSEITNIENPSTYQLLSNMDDNTIAMLSVENDSYLVDEVNARAGGVLILFKKTSVYFSSGLYFTYRYGEVITGVSGLGGTSFVWSNNTKTIHSYHSGSGQRLTSVDTYEKMIGWGGIATNARLTNDNDSIVIPKGVHHIEVSAYAVIESVADGDKFMQIFKNGTGSGIMIKSRVSGNGTLTITPLIMDVSQDDRIELRIYSNSLDNIRSKHFTIEVID